MTSGLGVFTLLRCLREQLKAAVQHFEDLLRGRSLERSANEKLSTSGNVKTLSVPGARVLKSPEGRRHLLVQELSEVRVEA